MALKKLAITHSGPGGKSTCLKFKCHLGHVDVGNNSHSHPFWPVWSLAGVSKLPKMAKLACFCPKLAKIFPVNDLGFVINVIFGQFCVSLSYSDTANN